MKVLGLDLAGKDENDTGFCLLDGSKVETHVVKADVEILELVKGADPDVIAIDAPLSFPEDGMYRGCDQRLRDRGYDVLSPNFPGMRVLVNRALSLVKKLKREDDFEVIEAFPRATEKILPVKKGKNMTEDEHDAFLCALTGKKYLQGEHENLDGIIIPEDRSERKT
ncbi:MAG: DUF429 domain-containing protein [Candidatus Aenigmatarchaeota archaeon]